jgi:ABC-2 type transport system ATP-binding protein
MPGDGDLVIETSGLRKEFRTRRGRRVVAVDDLDLAVPAGGVHGFLGPNGSGKTTTIRMLLGLARATTGRMTLFGEPVPQRLPAVMSRIGAVVEQPKFAPTFSGRKNLSLLARSVGVPSSAVADAIAQVGLEGREKESFKGYSLGMKQRLAIAATLLKSPGLLILDEPTNGLDPAGIKDIRTMISRLGESGVTVLLSSHILAEVQQVCDSVTIIGNGRVLASGTVDDLVGEQAVRMFGVVVSEPAEAADVLTRARFRVTRDGDRLTVEATEPTAASLGEEISRTLAVERIYPRELRPMHADLEAVFLQLTHDDSLRSGPATPPSEEEES